MRVAQLWKVNHLGNIDWCLGSSGVVYLDGRYGRTRIHEECKKKAQSESRFTKHNIVGYTVHRSINTITEEPINLIKL
jgi:hypothetical protein